MMTIITAYDLRGALGYHGKLLYNIPRDMRNFARLTKGKPILMGRKTWESLPNGSLKGRINVVVSRKYSEHRIQELDYSIKRGLHYNNTAFLNSFEDAVDYCRSISDDFFVIGGAEIYAQALPMADRIARTLVHDRGRGDTFFPRVDWPCWKRVFRKEWGSDDAMIPHCTYEVFERIQESPLPLRVE